jgi:hypothetical protein
MLNLYHAQMLPDEFQDAPLKAALFYDLAEGLVNGA